MSETTLKLSSYYFGLIFITHITILILICWCNYRKFKAHLKIISDVFNFKRVKGSIITMVLLKPVLKKYVREFFVCSRPADPNLGYASSRITLGFLKKHLTNAHKGVREFFFWMGVREREKVGNCCSRPLLVSKTKDTKMSAK